MNIELSGYTISDGGIVYGKLGNILTQYSNNGYMFVCLNGKTLSVHRLVAKAFLGERPPGHHIHHKDRNPSNNKLENLEYLTPEEHAEKHRALREKDREERMRLVRENRLRYLNKFDSKPEECKQNKPDEINEGTHCQPNIEDDFIDRTKWEYIW